MSSVNLLNDADTNSARRYNKAWSTDGSLTEDVLIGILLRKLENTRTARQLLSGV